MTRRGFSGYVVPTPVALSDDSIKWAALEETLTELHKNDHELGAHVLALFRMVEVLGAAVKLPGLQADARQWAERLEGTGGLAGPCQYCEELARGVHDDGVA